MPLEGQVAGDRARIAVPAATAAAALALIVLSASMPGHGFYSGDSGVKLIAARNAIAHPSRPFEIDVPSIGGTPAPLMDRFFVMHGGNHAHALQSPIFPALSAPFIAAFGVRGAYIIPLLSFVALVPLVERLRRRYAAPVPPLLTAAIVLLMNPLFFYALEFWEHAPAVMCVTASTVMALTGDRKGRERAGRAVLAGAIGGFAVLLRPETVWYVAALAVLARRRQRGLPFSAGVAAVGIAFMSLNYLESGNPAGPHAAANLAPLGTDWAATHWHRFQLWLVPGAMPSVAGVLLIAFGWIGLRVGIDLRIAQAIALTGAAVLAVEGARGAYERDSLWHAWPAGFLIFIPSAHMRGSSALWFLTAVSIAGILLTSTHDGGAQWGPRFLLTAMPALLPLVAIAAWQSSGEGRVRALRYFLLAVILCCGVWTTRASYRELRGTKRFDARLVDAVERHTRAGGYILTNVWWLDQIAAISYGSRTFLFTATPSVTTATLRQLEAANAGDAALVWTRESDGESLAAAVEGTCYRIATVQEIPERALMVATVSCSSSY